MRPILIFYSELMPYNILVLKELVKADCLLYVLKWSQNGYLFFPGNLSSIRKTIQRLIFLDTPNDKLIQMSYKRSELSKRITPEIIALILLSIDESRESLINDNILCVE